MPHRQISDDRKAAYYIGMIVSGIGIVLFLSIFVTMFANIGSPNSFDNFDYQAKSFGFRALGGMVLMIVGGVLRGLGARGLAGSGVVLDPEKAREDLEPWTRMAGGMVKDAADEAGVDLGKALNHGGHEDAPDDMPFDEKLRRLAKLHEEGVLSDEEYAAEKQKILDEQ
jgi:hypothetical protein